jgi:branched-chain amino acid transport system ATP-binding protein
MPMQSASSTKPHTAEPLLVRKGPASPYPLAVRDVTVQFGGLLAVNGASLDVEPGQIVGLIGPNGAGKTTLFECVSGFQAPTAGSIRYGEHELVGQAPWERPRLGIGRSLQSVRLFPELTVFDNLRIAHHLLVDSDALGDALGSPRSRRAEQAIAEHADRLLELVGMRFFRDKLAAELSYGTLRLLEIACILALEPRFLLLDEPSAGISQKETEELGPLLRKIQEATGSSILIIEHDMDVAFEVATEVTVMHNGEILAEGSPEDIRAHETVRQVYFGDAYA